MKVKEAQEKEEAAQQKAVEKKKEIIKGDVMADGLIHAQNGRTYFPDGTEVGGVNKNQ